MCVSSVPTPAANTDNKELWSEKRKESFLYPSIRMVIKDFAVINDDV